MRFRDSRLRRRFRRKRRPRPGLRTRRGVFLLPSLFTVANIFLGFFSISRTLEGDFAAAALFIGFAILADLADGRVARFADAASDFGRELDSLADMGSFGVAPAVLLYAWALQALPRTGWLVAALFAVCAGVRLARFNVGRLNRDPRFYTGLSTPAAAALVGAVVYWRPEPLTAGPAAVACLFATLALALAMNSPIPYRSFKSVAGRRTESYRTVVLVAVVIVAALAEPVFMYLFLSIGYATQPAVSGLLRLLRRGSGADEGPEPAVAPPDSS